MSLFDIISGWDKAFSDRNKAPYLENIARTQNTLKGIEAKNAPQYYRGRAQNQENEAGLSGLKFLQEPERFNMERQKFNREGEAGGITNQLNNLRVEELRNKLKFGGGFEPSSPAGKLLRDYKQVARMYGEDSEEAQQIKQAIEKNINGANGITVFDPRTGQPLVNMGGNSGGRMGSGPRTLVNPQTGEITAPLTPTSRTRDQKVVAGSENLQSYIAGVAAKLPQFQTRPKKLLTGLQGLLNENLPFLGANFEGPSTLAEGNADLISSVEGFMNNFNLTSTDLNSKMSKEIFAPQPGESEEFYKKRVEKQAKHLLEVDRRARERQIKGNVVGYTDASIQQKRASLEQQAKDAIARGADPEKVNAHFLQLMGQ